MTIDEVNRITGNICTGHDSVCARATPGRSVTDIVLHAMAKRIVYEHPNEVTDPAHKEQDKRLKAKWEAVPLDKPSMVSSRAAALDITVFVPKHSHLSPVVAFGGSDETGDWLTDFDRSGPGYTQFMQNKDYIEREVQRVFTTRAKNWAPLAEHVVLTGHSLGGALAQMAAAELDIFLKCARVVTFQSVGIGRRWLRLYAKRTAKPAVKHYMALGGVVSAVGSGHLPGTFVLVDADDAPNEVVEQIADQLWKNQARPPVAPRPRGPSARLMLFRKRDIKSLHTMDLLRLTLQPNGTLTGRRAPTMVIGHDPYRGTARRAMEAVRLQIGDSLAILTRGYSLPRRDKVMNDLLDVLDAERREAAYNMLFALSNVVNAIVEIEKIFAAAVEAVNKIEGIQRPAVKRLRLVLGHAVLAGYNALTYNLILPASRRLRVGRPLSALAVRHYVTVARCYTEQVSATKLDYPVPAPYRPSDAEVKESLEPQAKSR